MLFVCKAREIWSIISISMDLWERGINMGLSGDTEAEGATREVRAYILGEEEEKSLSQNFHSAVLSGKHRQAFHQ